MRRKLSDVDKDLLRDARQRDRELARNMAVPQQKSSAAPSRKRKAAVPNYCQFCIKPEGPCEPANHNRERVMLAMKTFIEARRAEIAVDWAKDHGITASEYEAFLKRGEAQQ